MDEFPVRFGSPLSFSSMIQRRLVRFLEPAPRNFFRINGAAPFLRAGADYRRIFVESTDDTVAQAYLENSVREYSEILAAHPTDIQVLGIGWNGHVAFNDPYVVGKTPASLMAYRANFGDPHLVKAVKLDDVCYEQQKAAYPGQTIPRWAISLTVPALIKAPVAFCIVPYEVKAEAVEKTIFNDVSEACPATVLRNHPNAYLFLDMASASRIWDRVKGI
jgi:glucosamine-6-phosphate deaminase